MLNIYTTMTQSSQLSGCKVYYLFNHTTNRSFISTYNIIPMEKCILNSKQLTHRAQQHKLLNKLGKYVYMKNELLYGWFAEVGNTTKTVSLMIK